MLCRDVIELKMNTTKWSISIDARVTRTTEERDSNDRLSFALRLGFPIRLPFRSSFLLRAIGIIRVIALSDLDFLLVGCEIESVRAKIR